MTQLIEYKCDFCRNTHFDNAEIIGLYWVGKELSFVDKSKSANHLCRTCINAIIEGAKKETKHDK